MLHLQADDISRNRGALLLLLILSVALLLRVYGIDFGLPELLHPDEPFEINRALRLAAGSFDWRRAGKGGLYYLLFAEIGVAFAFLHLRGIVSGPAQFAEWFVTHEHFFYLAGRWTCALLSTASVLLVFLIGKRMANRQVGLLAAALLAICPIVISEAHYSTVDDPLVFFLLCSWLFLLKAMDQERRRDWVAAAVFGGLAMITKLPAAIMLLPLLTAPFLLSRGSWKRRLGLSGILFALFMVVTIIGEPGYFRGIGERLNKYLFLFLPRAADQTGSEVVKVGAALTVQQDRNVFLYYLQQMAWNAGWPLLVTAFMSLLWFSWRRHRFAWLLGSFLLPYLLLISLTESNLVYGRYLLPVLPLIFLLAAAGIITVWRKYSEGPAHRRWIGLVFLLLIFCSVLPHTWLAARKHALPSTRMLARDWIENHVAVDTTILFEGGREHRSQYMVPLYNRLSNIDGMIEDLRERDPGKARYWELKREALKNLQVPRYDLQMVIRHDLWPDYATVKGASVDYVVVDTKSFSGGSTEGLGSALRSRRCFYNEMKKNSTAVRVASFIESKDSWGPGLEIYRLSR